MKRKGGILESWRYHNGVVYALVFGDPKWPAGAYIRTSTAIRTTKLTVETRNTIYRLGNEYEYR